MLDIPVELWLWKHRHVNHYKRRPSPWELMGIKVKIEGTLILWPLSKIIAVVSTLRYRTYLVMDNWPYELYQEWLLFCPNFNIFFENILFILFYYFLWLAVLPGCMTVQQLCVWYMRRPEKDVSSPGSRVTDSYELPRGEWQSNPGPLEEQFLLLNHIFCPNLFES